MNSRIILAKNIKIDKQYTNVLSYEEEDMLNLCLNQEHLVAQDNSYSFIRSNNSIMTGFTYEQCLQANYIAFQNSDYSNKWFFAWIDEVIYKGEKNTEILFTIDSWSTWFEYWTKKMCYINRQHVNDDTIGLHTINENLDVGEVIQEQVTEDLSYSNSNRFYIVVASNWNIKDNSTGDELLPSGRGTQNANISVYNNNVFGYRLFLFPITALQDYTNVALFILRTNSDNHINDIQNMFVLPDIAVNRSQLTQHNASVSGTNFSWYTLQNNINSNTFNSVINKRNTFSDFQPKNNKCFCYPYNYLFVTNNQGNNNIYKYEDFTTENCIFENQFSVSIGGSGRLVPKNYKNMLYNDDEALPLGKYPTCGWSSDAYTNWLTKNSVNLATSGALLAGSIAATVATGGATLPVAVGATMSVASNVANTIGQFNQASLMPNISGGQPTGDVIWSVDANKFSIREMRVKTEYLKIIDDYFTRFGYAIKCLEMPNITGRKYWNYIEIGSNEEIGYGSVPSKHMDIINNICRRGVTIWHSHTNLGDYSLNNIIENI